MSLRGITSILSVQSVHGSAQPLIPVLPYHRPLSTTPCSAYRRSRFHMVNIVIINVVKIAIPAGSPMAEMAPLHPGQDHSMRQFCLPKGL